MDTKTITLIPYSLCETDLFIDTSPQQKDYVLKVRDLPEKNKPREKLLAQGLAVLSTQELLIIVLSNGTKKEGILEMSSRIVRQYGERSIIAEKDPQKLARELDIPLIKACQVVAIGELGRRFYEKNTAGGMRCLQAGCN